MQADVFFISHGAPSVAIEEDDFTRAVRAFGATLDGTRAIVVVSAHWQTRGLRVNAVAHPQPIYDFGGFAPELYAMRYDAPGDPQLAREIAQLTGAEMEMERGWDHGVWVPFTHVRPQHDIPIVELSLPTNADLLDLGRKLAPLRERGVAIAGSGGIVHNLRLLHFEDKFAPPDEWSSSFDDHIADALSRRDVSAFSTAPHAALAAPSPEHFDPIYVVLGATTADDHLETIYSGFHYGTLSMRSFAFRE
jgi:4,5-DOPA dioxygenase extradiol